jgi:hypothetical protein
MELAGALYLGSGLGLALWRSARRMRRNAPKTEAALGALIGRASAHLHRAGACWRSVSKTRPNPSSLIN